MPRGGYREGSGGKPTWKHGKTKVIRVPEVLAEKVIEYARRIDSFLAVESAINSSLISVTESKVINLSGIPTYSFDKGSAVYLSDLIAFGYQIKPDGLHSSVINKNRFKQQSRANQLKNDINNVIKDLK